MADCPMKVRPQTGTAITLVLLTDRGALSVVAVHAAMHEAMRWLCMHTLSDELYDGLLHGDSVLLVQRARRYGKSHDGLGHATTDALHDERTDESDGS